MLIGDPLGEGSNANSTDSELWRAENSFLRMRGNSDAQKGVAFMFHVVIMLRFCVFL